MALSRLNWQLFASLERVAQRHPVRTNWPWHVGHPTSFEALEDAELVLMEGEREPGKLDDDGGRLARPTLPDDACLGDLEAQRPPNPQAAISLLGEREGLTLESHLRPIFRSQEASDLRASTPETEGMDVLCFKIPSDAEFRKIRAVLASCEASFGMTTSSPNIAGRVAKIRCKLQGWATYDLESTQAHAAGCIC